MLAAHLREHTMSESIVFSEEQKAVLLALASRWLSTALQAERLAEEYPKEEGKLPLLRRAAHYRDSAVELQMVADANNPMPKSKRENHAIAEAFYAVNDPEHIPAWNIQNVSAAEIGKAKKLIEELIAQGVSLDRAKPQLERLAEQIKRSTVGKRLREERKRLGFNQAEFGAIGGVQKRSQIDYEKDRRSPDANYLFAVAAAGVDVNYVITGNK